MDYNQAANMSLLAEKLSLYSFQCYGLLLLAYLVYHLNNHVRQCATKTISVVPIFCILSFGVLIVMFSFCVKGL